MECCMLSHLFMEITPMFLEICSHVAHYEHSRILLTPMGVLATGTEHDRPSARPQPETGAKKSWLTCLQSNLHVHCMHVHISEMHTVHVSLWIIMHAY